MVIASEERSLAAGSHEMDLAEERPPPLSFGATRLYRHIVAFQHRTIIIRGASLSILFRLNLDRPR